MTLFASAIDFYIHVTNSTLKILVGAGLKENTINNFEVMQFSRDFINKYWLQ